jgi:glycosyltransferase involved in cell wall biosynthesis
VVATTGGALPEVVGTDGLAGVLVPPADPSALGAAIAELLSDPDRIERMGAAGRERVVDRFTWAACAERTVEVYREVLGVAATRSGSPAVAGLR